MKTYEKHLREILQNADAETVRKIAEVTPSADVKTKERIFNSVRTSCHIQNAQSFETEAYPAITESRYNRYRTFGTAVACLVVCGGVVGGLSTLQKPLTTSEQVEQITMEQLTEAISTTATAPVNNIKTAGKSDKETTKETNSAQPKETVINPVPVIVPVAETVPAVNAEATVNPETTAPTAETTAVQTTAVPVDNTTKETVSVDSVTLEQFPAENVASAQENEIAPVENVETVAPISTTVAENITPVQTTAPIQTTVAETIAIAEETQPIQTKKNKDAVQLGEEPVKIGNFTIVRKNDDERENVFIASVKKETRKAVHAEDVYMPEYVPEGADFNTWQNKRFCHNVIAPDEDYFISDIWYKMNTKECTSIMIEQKIHSDFEIWVYNDAHEVVPVNINGHEGFTVTGTSDGGLTELYEIFWEQDGYVFTIEAYDVSEAYKAELLKMAESMVNNGTYESMVNEVTDEVS